MIVSYTLNRARGQLAVIKHPYLKFALCIILVSVHSPVHAMYRAAKATFYPQD